MDILVFILPILIICGIIAVVVIDKKEGKKINVDDISVRDLIEIKGEMFSVVGYSSDGLMRLRKKSNEKEYLIKFDDNVELRKMDVLGTTVIKVNNFKGTVGGDYMNLIKK